MMFPRFEGFEPKIWLRKCVDYFTLFHVPEAVWVTSASLNMEGNASRWFEVYKLQHGAWAQGMARICSSCVAEVWGG
jgi:hypothetical protein